MAVINLNQKTSGGSSATFVLVPTDTYRVKCVEADLEDDTFAKPNKDGSLPKKIKTVWEVTTLTEEQEELAEEAGEEWVGARIWHRFNPFYGDVRDGGPSKFKEFIDNLSAQGLLPNLDLDSFDLDTLVGIEQKASILHYTKTMGTNAGQPGNKIAGFSSVRPPKKAKKVEVVQEAEDEEPLF
jgi:hypothetical protein